MDKVLFSITTPCFNSVKTIRRTFDSILSQEFTDFEYIIIDGGSTDGTLDVIKEYEPLFKGRMKWISEPDKGIYDAFNKGIERSQGIYCWNVNSDDYIEPNVLRKLSSLIIKLGKGNLPVISGGLNYVSQGGSVLSTQYSNKEKARISFKYDGIGVPHPATLVPREIYLQHGVYDTYYKIIGDMDWFHRVYAAGVDFIFVDYVLTNMMDGGISSMFVYKRSLRDRVHFLNKYYHNPLVWFLHWARWTKSFFYQKYQINTSVNFYRKIKS